MNGGQVRLISVITGGRQKAQRSEGNKEENQQGKRPLKFEMKAEETMYKN